MADYTGQDVIYTYEKLNIGNTKKKKKKRVRAK